jgi:hypothetical protein
MFDRETGLALMALSAVDLAMLRDVLSKVP